MISVHKVLLKSLISVVLLMFFAVSANAEYVFLKDGAVIKGTIIKDGLKLIILRDSEKKFHKITRNKIMRILYTEFQMTKKYIQKRDGRGFAAFLVEEDRTSYTFRKKLNSSEEIKIDRADVLFIAEKNPSGLQGKADLTSVNLTWLPPYDQVKEYRIYKKMKLQDKYELAETTDGVKKCTINNLSSNTTYYFIVVSIDHDNYESTPSNELKITTKNRAPENITNAMTIMLPSGEFMIKCDETTDLDGKVVAYRLYAETEKGRKRIAEVDKPPFAIKKLEGVNRLYVTAVDDLGAESVQTRVRRENDIMLSMELSPVFIMPLGKFSDMVKYGYGGTIRFTSQAFYLSSWSLLPGFEIGCVYFNGKPNSLKKGFSHIWMITAMPGVSYIYQISKNLFLKPELYAGLYIFRATYNFTDTEEGRAGPVQGKKTVIDFSVRSGISVMYKISETIEMNAGTGFGYIKETDGNLFYAQMTIGATYNL